jgi:GTPase SAR1 family protein
MKIALTGLHGQGKTTLINSLKQQEFFREYIFADSPTRAISKLYPINEQGSQDTQLSVMMGHYINQLSPKVVLDRCAIDGIVYTNYFKRRDRINSDIYAAIQYLFSYLIKQYDYIFYIVPELENTFDGTRSTDKEFFEEIKQEFTYYIAHLPVQIYNVSGTVEERVKTILNTINL